MRDIHSRASWVRRQEAPAIRPNTRESYVGPVEHASNKLAAAEARRARRNAKRAAAAKVGG